MPGDRRQVLQHLSRQALHSKVTELRPDALLTAAEVAEWLKVSRRQVQRLGIPWIDLGRKTPRYQVKDVVSWLETRRREVGR